MQFYAFTDVGESRIFIVGDAKTLAGKEMQFKGDALGRVCPVCWFERQASDDDVGIVVTPIYSDGDSLRLTPLTLAEILRAAGHPPPVPANATPRDVEVGLEAGFLTHGLVQYKNEHEPTNDEYWKYVSVRANRH